MNRRVGFPTETVRGAGQPAKLQIRAQRWLHMHRAHAAAGPSRSIWPRSSQTARLHNSLTIGPE